MKLEKLFVKKIEKNIIKQNSFTITGLTMLSRLLLVKYIKDILVYKVTNNLQIYSEEEIKKINKTTQPTILGTKVSVDS